LEVVTSRASVPRGSPVAKEASSGPASRASVLRPWI